MFGNWTHTSQKFVNQHLEGFTYREVTELWRDDKGQWRDTVQDSQGNIYNLVPWRRGVAIVSPEDAHLFSDSTTTTRIGSISSNGSKDTNMLQYSEAWISDCLHCKNSPSQAIECELESWDDSYNCINWEWDGVLEPEMETVHES